MIAALPMYDRPETAAANSRLWALLRDALRADRLPAPDRLSRPTDLWALWQAPDLVLAQTCGLPFRARLKDRVQLVGTPDYQLPGCAPGYYTSVLVARKSDAGQPLDSFAQRIFAYNDGGSQSGWAAPVAHAPFLAHAPRIETGSHRASAKAVAEGAADLAALDAQSWRMMQRWDDTAAQLVEITRTAPTPGLPLICANSLPAARIATAARAAIAALSPQHRATLDLQGLADIPMDLYLSVPTPPPPGQALG